MKALYKNNTFCRVYGYTPNMITHSTCHGGPRSVILVVLAECFACSVLWHFKTPDAFVVLHASNEIL